MAWIRYRQGALGPKTPFVQWRCRLPREQCEECRRRKGRTHSQPLDTTDERLVKEWLREYTKLERGAEMEPLTVSAEEALERYMIHRSFVVSEQTLEITRGFLEPLWESWARVPLQRWSRPMLEQYIHGKTGWGPRTIQMFLGACKSFISWAAESDVAAPDFVGKFKGPPVPVQEVECFTLEERDVLLAAAEGHRLELAIGLGCLAGHRYGEIIAARASFVDWKKSTLLVRSTKTHTDRRIPFGPRLEAVLKRRRVIAGPLVRIGGTKNRRNNARSLKTLCRNAGVPELSWHALRHTYGTQLAAQGEHYRVIGQLMGHAPGSTVTLRYLHTNVERMREAVSKFG